MPDSHVHTHLLFEAVSFAARAHKNQLRKDGRTPYAAHPFRVCLVVRHLFGIDDPKVMIAAVLHDTIEDTTTDFDDIAEHFGADVAEWVAFLTKDMRLPEQSREEAYHTALVNAPWQVVVCKLADIYDNLTDSHALSTQGRERTQLRAKHYLNGLKPTLPEEAEHAFRLVEQKLIAMQLS